MRLKSTITNNQLKFFGFTIIFEEPFMATRDTGSVYGIYIDNDKQISYNHISMKDESVLPAIMDLVEAGFIEEKEDI